MLTLPGTDLVVHELCLGGNVFGWGANMVEKKVTVNLRINLEFSR
jgi:hypothetical protein